MHLSLRALSEGKKFVVVANVIALTASRRPALSARTISTIPITERVKARIYFHMAVAYY